MKDFYMLLEMKKFAGMMAVIGLLLLITNSGGEGFVISYMTIMSAFMVLSTLSQDEGGKGIQFLLTLPVTRKIYVKEKYCLGLLNGIGFWLVSAVVVGIVTAVRNRGTAPVDFICDCCRSDFVCGDWKCKIHGKSQCGCQRDCRVDCRSQRFQLWSAGCGVAGPTVDFLQN